MFLSELFTEEAVGRVELHDLAGVPEKALPVLTRLARFHQISGLVFDRRKNVWIASDSEGIEPFIRDAKHITSAAGKGTRMNNESVECWLRKLSANRQRNK